MYGPLYFRSLEHDKTIALKNNYGNFDKHLSLSTNAKNELLWWKENVTDSFNVISHGLPSSTLTTDASCTGWGAVYEGDSTGGIWSIAEQTYRINYLELFAVFLGLQCYCKALRNTHIRLRIDNTTAIAVINHMGTSHSQDCNKLAKTIWEWCITRNIWISAVHIPGVDNITADAESRNKNIHTEWMLNRDTLSGALNKIEFCPDVDLFASRVNAQFPKYVSYRPDPGAIAIDALSLNIAKLKFYAFPPFSVISMLLQKIEEQKATGIVVLPDWPTQAWYPKAMQMCLSPPIRLPPRKRLLSLPGRPQEIHPLQKSLALLVCLLSSNS